MALQTNISIKLDTKGKNIAGNMHSVEVRCSSLHLVTLTRSKLYSLVWPLFGNLWAHNQHNVKPLRGKDLFLNESKRADIIRVFPLVPYRFHFLDDSRLASTSAVSLDIALLPICSGHQCSEPRAEQLRSLLLDVNKSVFFRLSSDQSFIRWF